MCCLVLVLVVVVVVVCSESQVFQPSFILGLWFSCVLGKSEVQHLDPESSMLQFELSVTFDFFKKSV